MLEIKAREVVETANELKRDFMKILSDSDMVMTMSGEEFELFKKMLQMLDESTELVLEQAKMFDEIDNKLDRIMLKLES